MKKSLDFYTKDTERIQLKKFSDKLLCPELTLKVSTNQKIQDLRGYNLFALLA